ncbi:hypothetical protein ILUMI_06492 [Ignelater luminosus]|uniref:Uncharacterized protein n=1 Tax=Ignelater luminosus TaxID=2038154 RepID=A0A8K0GCI7_IGNLU|nr:hypothetical protein ILUMI_06492 [Ignelater luminosus]
MYQQMPEEYDMNMQEFPSKRGYSDSPGCINTSQRPYSSPLNSRQIVNATSERINRPLYISDYQNMYDQYGRISYPTFQSTPTNSNIPYLNYSEHDPEVDPNLSWIPKYSPNLLIGQGEPRSHHSAYNSSHHQESTIKSSRHESIIEWFDRTVEAELQKRRTGSSVGENLVNLSPSSHPSKSLQGNPILYEASTAGIDIEGKLQPGQDTELLDAVDKLAKAEAMIAFEGAIKAAEKAAANAPPELAEEAAAAGAKGFQAELTGLVKQEIPGIKPIEVIGYVGITRPKKPKKSNFVK